MSTVYVSNLISSISKKLFLHQSEYDSENKKIQLIEYTKISQSYINKVLSSIINKFKDKIRTNYLNNQKDNLISNETICFINSVFKNIKDHFQKETSNEENKMLQNLDLSANKNKLMISEKQTKNPKVKRNVTKNISILNKTTITNSNLIELEKKSISDRKKSDKIKEEKNGTKDKNSIIQQKLINNTFNDNCKNIALNYIKKSESINYKEDNKEENDKMMNISRKSVLAEYQNKNINHDKKKNVFKAQQRHSINEKKKIIEENKDKFIIKDEKVNDLLVKKVKNNQRKKKFFQTQELINSGLEENIIRDKSSDNIKSKSIDRLKRSISKLSEKTLSVDNPCGVIQSKVSTEFESKVENISKNFVQKLPIKNQVSKKNTIKNLDNTLISSNLNGNYNTDESYIKGSLDKRMAKKKVIKKIKDGI